MVYDVLIVGGGPAGLYAAFYAGLRDLKVRVLEADREWGGRLRYYPEKLVWDVGGQPPVRGEVLRGHLEAQARTFDADMRTDTLIVAASSSQGIWTLVDQRGEHHRGRTVILAVGYGTLGTRRLRVPGAEGDPAGVQYSVPQPEALRGRRVLISGGGNSAVDWAHQLATVAERVTVVHRRSSFRAHEALVARLESAGIEVLVPWTVTAVEVSAGRLVAVSLAEAAGGRVEKRAVDTLLVGHGMEFSPGTELLTLRGQPGVFVAGDCGAREGKVYLIAATFPEAAEAVNTAKVLLDPTAEKQAMVSSHHAKLVGAT